MDKKLKCIDNHALGQRMRDERERLGYTREKLAEKVDLAPLYIGQLERGERQMSLDTLYRITKCLNISAEYLLHGNSPGSDLVKERVASILNKCSNDELLQMEIILRQVLAFKRE